MKTTYRIYTFNVALVLLVSSFTQPLAAEELYKWVDETGRVTYQSSPPPESAVKVDKSILSNDIADDLTDDSGAEVLPIKFYTKPECPICDDARTYFEENGIATAEVDITENTLEAERMEKQFGHNNVPTVLVGSKSITGFQKNMLDKILKNAGYDIQMEDENQ